MGGLVGGFISYVELLENPIPKTKNPKIWVLAWGIVGK